MHGNNGLKVNAIMTDDRTALHGVAMEVFHDDNPHLLLCD